MDRIKEISPKEDRKYTYADYLTWQENNQWELIDGVPYMQAAPSWQHQAISAALISQFYNYLSGKDCQVFAAPFDLRLPIIEEQDEDVTNVLQPDIVVICDKDKLKGTGYYGTPTLVIEISSPSTNRADKIFKFNKYEKAGVNEYWIVEPDGKFVSVYVFQSENKYGRPELYTEDDKIKVTVFPDLLIDLNAVFASV